MVRADVNIIITNTSLPKANYLIQTPYQRLSRTYIKSLPAQVMSTKTLFAQILQIIVQINHKVKTKHFDLFMIRSR